MNFAIKSTWIEGNHGHDAALPEAPDFDAAMAVGQAIVGNLGQVLLDAREAITAAAIAALAGGHLLIEDVPGVGKTVLARAIATSLGAELSRVQGHPDLLPSDITGISVYSPEDGQWEFHPGPVFAHVVLFDELNRTPPRTQSALLETMEEHQVSVDGKSWSLPRPHMVIGTQNPYSQRGTFPLVEGQLDRFAVATSIGYPDAASEARMALHEGGKYALNSLQSVSKPETWREAQQVTKLVEVSPLVAPLRRRDLPRQSGCTRGASRDQSPCRDLAHQVCPGARHPLVENLCHALGRESSCRGLSSPSHPHGCRRREHPTGRARRAGDS